MLWGVVWVLGFVVCAALTTSCLSSMVMVVRSMVMGRAVGL